MASGNISARSRTILGYFLSEILDGASQKTNWHPDYLLGNWQIDGILTLKSGRPYTVEDAGDIANTGNFNFVGYGYERPNQVGQSQASAPNAKPVD